MKILGLIVWAAVAPIACASYELMLVVDQDSDYISRIDPVTGASLGTFGGLQLTDPQSVAVIPGTSECVVFDNFTRRMNRFNYSTGQYISGFDIPTMSAASVIVEPFTDGTFLLWGYLTSQAIRISSTGALLNTYAVPAGAGSLSSAGVGPGNSVFAAWSSINKIQRYSQTGAVQGLSAAGPTLGPGAQMNVNAQYGYATQSNNLLVKFNPGNPATSIETASVGSGNSAFATAFGHGSLVYAAGISGTGTGTVWVLDGVKKQVVGAFNPSGVKTPVNMAMVLAPEPGTLIALGLGVLALKRRKK